MSFQHWVRTAEIFILLNQEMIAFRKAKCFLLEHKKNEFSGTSPFFEDTSFRLNKLIYNLFLVNIDVFHIWNANIL